MAKHLIPKITAYMLREQPDQVSQILNQLIDEVNKLQED